MDLFNNFLLVENINAINTISCDISLYIDCSDCEFFPIIHKGARTNHGTARLEIYITWLGTSAIFDH